MLSGFHPATASWFQSQFKAPTPAQNRAWPEIQAKKHTLVAAPTGSGKTLAAFLSAIDGLVRQSENGPLPDATTVLYISPLKALGNDIERNLRAPLQGIGEAQVARGHSRPEIRAAVRSGDTTAAERRAMVKRSPHILVTTPESFYILLTSDSGRRMLSTVETVIVDEIHAVVEGRRGAHLALSLERLEALAGQPPVRIGLSATQRPIAAVADFLVGTGRPPCAIIDEGHGQTLDIALEVPGAPLETVMSAEVRETVFDRMADLAREHRSTLVFVNTRRVAERFARHLGERLGEDAVAAHHGSLSKERRLRAEQRLKSGALRVMVATASLELGIDIGEIELVCQVGSPRRIATFLQRVGRAGHFVGGVPKGRLFPESRDDLVECAALVRAVIAGQLDRLCIPSGGLDVLAQQIVAETAAQDDKSPWSEEALFSAFSRAWPYQNLSRDDFDELLQMLSDGFTTRRGRRGAWLHRDQVQGRLMGRRGARLAAITSGGAIPELADYQVVLDPEGTVVGSLNEDFAIESLPGDVFQLGNTAWRIKKVESGRVRVVDAAGQSPTLPFWFGEAPGRTAELSLAVAELRREVTRSASTRSEPTRSEPTRFKLGESTIDEAIATATQQLMTTPGIGFDAAEQIATYLQIGHRCLGALPDQKTLIVERFFDEAGGMQLVVHAPFGARLNRAWGLALRKRFCRAFNFELQAAATDDAILLSLGATHSFPLDDVYKLLNAKTVRDVLVQALLDAPMFQSRWRWNAGRALAVLRFRGGRKVPPQLQRMDAEDLVAVVFPDQLACLENVVGEREVPDHPLVRQTIDDCLHEAMDIGALEHLLRGIEAGEHRLHTVDATEPSPLALAIVNANPYAFLDDAPLEERRTQAVKARNWLDADSARDLATLDPAAIARVRDEVRPNPRNAEELHDALVIHGVLTPGDLALVPDWERWLAKLSSAGRATCLGGPQQAQQLVAAERLALVRRCLGERPERPAITLPAALADRDNDADALQEIVRGRLELLGPVTAGVIAGDLGLDEGDIAIALAALEAQGFVFQGYFEPGISGLQWCERRLLSRIHRYTLGRLRAAVKPVSHAAWGRFLVSWHGLDAPVHQSSAAWVTDRVALLHGWSAPARAWEHALLPERLPTYDALMLDGLCLSGRMVWARLGAREASGGPVSTSPITLLPRDLADAWRRASPPAADLELPAEAESVVKDLARHGASFADDLALRTGQLQTQLETTLGRLVNAGRVGSDGFGGLRSLITTAAKTKRRGRRGVTIGVGGSGRWSLTPQPKGPLSEDDVETIAWALLRRWGVVCYRIVRREQHAPPWRLLRRALRRLEDRGEVRGGRFIAGFSGEQFALPDAVGALRRHREAPEEPVWVSLSAVDPISELARVAEARLPAVTGNRLLLRDGIPVATLVADEVHWLVPADKSAQWAAEKRLRRVAGTHSPIGLGLRHQTPGTASSVNS
ncbi:MAG: DEAD/DEAH box helicase [Myxococcales bacterium]|nr:DEAD/DEAH box helicase [Myxococcales bacterium]